MTINTRVRQLLVRQDLRDSDKKLLLAFWHTEGLHLTDEQRQMFMEKCTPAESITRARRELRSEFPASKQVEEERYRKFTEYKNDHASAWL
jgi:hypothetical protein